jgi:predicted kinase
MGMILLSNVKAGDEFFGCEYGKNQHMRALSDATHLEELNGKPWNGWSVEVLRLPQADRFVLLEASPTSMTYKLKLYSEPVYLTKEDLPSSHRQVVYMTCGYPGSGKSTWAKRKLEEIGKCVVVSRDFLRYMIKGGVYKFDEDYEEYVKEVSIMAALRALQRGYSVIIDETYLTKESRKGTITAIKCQFPEVDIVCVHCVEDKRNVEMRMEDSRGISEERWRSIIDGMRKVFENPTSHEGFSKIELVKISHKE